ncbi:hypothetical protein [Micromonospora purpureochromogenes]|uniref:Uncharacterized protein n=1 Tax=Micromonospora purpureochromogenes TaxID=47872 RepID=A0ABX2RK75_9ACTN|nr:hypothetical protein [Micromonospora purpureochromogenes]NYF55827.1 hypothetical protein [Micromonospora purpureochromogenes]
MLAVPAFLVGPSAADPGATTPTAVTAGSSADTTLDQGAPGVAGATRTTSEASTPGTPSGTTSTSPAGTAGLTAEQTRTRSATIAPAPRPPRSFCGGALSFGTVASCGLIIGQAADTWTFTTTADSDVLYSQVVQRVAGVDLAVRVNHSDGWKACDINPYEEYLDQCRLGPAGTYTLTVTTKSGSGKGAYTLSIESRRTPSACGQVSGDVFSWAYPGAGGTLPAGSAPRCFTFDQPTGSKLFIAEPHLRDRTGLRAEIIDARHQRLCQSLYADFDCTLDTAGPYRLFVEQIDGKASAYNLRLPRISQAVGCAALSPGSSDGALTGTGRLAPNQRACHTFSATAGGKVDVRLDQAAWTWKLYDDAGGYICNQSSVEYCVLPAAGRYTLLPWSGNDYTARDYQVTVNP